MYWPWRWRTAPWAYKVHTKSPRNQSPSTLTQSQKNQRREKIISPINSSPRKNPFNQTTGNGKGKIDSYELGRFLNGIEVEFPSGRRMKRRHRRRLRRGSFGTRRWGAEPFRNKSADRWEKNSHFSLSIFSLLAKENGVFCAGVDLEKMGPTAAQLPNIN